MNIRVKNYALIVPLVILFLYFLPYFILGEDIKMRVSDSLDSNLVWLKDAANNTNFSRIGVDEVHVETGDHERSWISAALRKILHFRPQVILFKLFSPFTAYVINLMILHITAFLGFFFLIRKKATEFYRSNQLMVGLLSVGYATIAFWEYGGLGLAGIPMLLFCAECLVAPESKRFRRIGCLVFILLYPTYSSLIFSGIFVVSLLFLLAIFGLITKFYRARGFVLTATIISLIYVYQNLSLFQSFIRTVLFKNVDISDTNARLSIATHGVSFQESIVTFLKGLHYGFQSHSPGYQFPIIILLVLLSLFLSFFIRLSKDVKKEFYFYAILIFLFSVIYGFYEWDKFVSLARIFQVVDLSRFGLLIPYLFYYCLTLSMIIFISRYPSARFFLLSLLFIQILLNFKRNSNQYTYRTIFNNVMTLQNPFNLTDNEHYSYKEFYAESTFNRIRTFINKDNSSYKVACLGFPPAVAQYNGFHTIDGYSVSHSMAYKKQFRKIIEKEIEKSEQIRKVFDDWGSTCYLFSSEIGTDIIGKLPKDTINNLQLSTQAFKELNGEYIISNTMIMNYKEIKLTYVKEFNNCKEQRFYLFKVSEF